MLELASGVKADVDKRIARAIQRALEGKALDGGPVAPLPAGGGVTGDPSGSARDLFTLAIWAETIGDHELARDLLGRAHRHAVAHGKWIAQQGTNFSITGDRLNGELQVSADWLTEHLTTLTSVPDHLRLVAAQQRVRAGFGASSLLAATLEEPLQELLSNGARDGEVAAVASAAYDALGDDARCRRVASAGAPDFERLRRVAAALAHLNPTAKAMRDEHGSGIPKLLDLVGPLHEDRLVVWAGHHPNPDVLERAQIRARPGGSLPRSLQRTATDDADAVDLARALLRRARLARQAEGASPDAGVGVRVNVTAAVLARLASHHPEGSVGLVEEHPPGKGSTFLLSGALRLAASTPAGPVQVVFTAALEESRSKREESRRDLAADRLHKAGVPPGRIDRTLSPAPAAHGDPSPRPDDPRLPDPWSLLGAERCQHPGAKWHGTHLKWLSCDRCGRERVADVPAHRFDDPISDEEGYLKGVRFRATLLGDTRPVKSITQLRARDGEASLDPADYALGPAPETPAARTTSLADALGRRRS